MTELENEAKGLLLNAYYCFEGSGREKNEWLASMNDWIIAFYTQERKENE